MNDEQIKHMVDRFLGWPLPENFNPDGGVSFRRFGNEGTAHEYRNNPTGTNLLDYAQATEMVRYMVDGLSPAFPVSLLAEYRATHKDCKDLTGHPDALPSQRRDWRCDLCKQADEYTQPPSPKPSAAQAGPERRCVKCNRLMTGRVGNRTMCLECDESDALAEQAPVDGGRAELRLAKAINLLRQAQEYAMDDGLEFDIADFLSSAASPAPIPVSPEPRVEEIRKRMEKITPGPWELERNPDLGNLYIKEVRGNRGRVCRLWNDRSCTEENGEFIAAAPDDIRYLLSKLQGEL